MSTFTIRQEVIPENTNLSGGPLGRHINHDSRSWAYRVEPALTSPETKIWTRVTPILDQGNLGSCTGNASAGQLGTEPFVGTTPKTFIGNEADAIEIYSLATQLDGYQGTYPPEDTGSDGLSAGKACKQLGLISGYTHAMSADDMISALQKGPGMVGVNWMTGMDNINTTTGEIKPTGQVRGGHEFEVFGVDLARGIFWFDNSWGSSWGLNGTMFMTVENFADLLKADGDATFFTPLSQPAPTPTPPAPGPVIDSYDAALVKAMDTWERTIISRITRAGRAKIAYNNWKNARGYQ